MSQRYVPSFSILVGDQELVAGGNADIVAVSITDCSDQVDAFGFTVRERHPEPGHFAGGPELRWLDADVFDEGTEVEIRMGYVGNLGVTLVGEITGVSCSFPSSGVPILQVRGYSLAHRLQRTRRRTPFESGTDAGIAREIASEMGWDADVEDTEAEHPLVSPNDATYAGLLNERARRVGYELTVKGRTLHFRRPAYLDNPDPEMTLEWGRDLVDFTPRINTYNQATSVRVRSPQTAQGGGKEAIVGQADAGDEGGSMGDRTGAQRAQDLWGENLVLVEDRGVASQQEANDIARAELRRRSMDYMHGSGTCIGNPDLHAGIVVELSNLGRRFSGNYYVTQATHTIDASGYRTRFQVRRNAR